MLNKASTAINDEKIRIKKLLLEPFGEFEAQCKELISMINDVSTNIDSQVKEFENKEKQEKINEIAIYFTEVIGEFRELIDLDNVLQEQWLNKSFSIKKVKLEIDHIIAKTRDDLICIDNQFKDLSINKAVKDYYFRNINDSCRLSASLNEGVRIIENNKKIQELSNVLEETKSDENIVQIDFRVFATKEQLMKLKQYLNDNNIKFSRV